MGLSLSGLASTRRRGAAPTIPRILVIDDDSIVRSVVRVALTAHGWAVAEATTTTDGIAQATARPPDVILLDVGFKGETRDGFTVCRELRTHRATQKTPIVLFTALDDTENRALASAVGATAFIAKPFGPLELVATLRLVLEHGPDPGVGLYLVDAGVVTPSQLERAIAEQKLRQGPDKPIGELLVEMGFATESDVRLALARQSVARVKPKSVAALNEIRIAIADDHASVREALRTTIAAESGLNVVGLAIDGDDALRVVRTLRPDVLVLDNDMPKRRGLDVLRAIRAEATETNVVFFTLDESVRDPALAGGAAAVVTKDQPIGVLIAEIRKAARRRTRPEASAGVVLAVRAARSASGILARQQRRMALLGVMGVAYAGAFLLLEPILGASSSFLGLAPVAFAGALFGPETGIVAAVLTALLTAVLWQATGHSVGEPVITVGGNGLGVAALIGVGAGFGVMRIARGRFDQAGRSAAAIAEAADALLGSESGPALALLAQAATEAVHADGALLYMTVPGGGTEIVAGTGALARYVGTRERADAVSRAMGNRSASTFHVDRAAIGVELPKMRSGIAAPLLADDGSALGAIVVLLAHRAAYTADDVTALASFARFASHVVTMRAAAPSAIGASLTEGV